MKVDFTCKLHALRIHSTSWCTKTRNIPTLPLKPSKVVELLSQG